MFTKGRFQMERTLGCTPPASLFLLSLPPIRYRSGLIFKPAKRCSSIEPFWPQRKPVPLASGAKLSALFTPDGCQMDSAGDRLVCSVHDHWYQQSIWSRQSSSGPVAELSAGQTGQTSQTCSV